VTKGLPSVGQTDEQSGWNMVAVATWEVGFASLRCRTRLSPVSHPICILLRCRLFAMDEEGSSCCRQPSVALDCCSLLEARLGEVTCS
jgi:hypothetical protein